MFIFDILWVAICKGGYNGGFASKKTVIIPVAFRYVGPLFVKLAAVVKSNESINSNKKNAYIINGGAP